MEETKDINVKANIDQVYQDLIALQASCRDYKKSVDETKSEVFAMEANLELTIGEVPRSYLPQISGLFKDLQKGISSQKGMNESLQKQITGLKKQGSLIMQHIIATDTSASIIHDNIGL